MDNFSAVEFHDKMLIKLIIEIIVLFLNRIFSQKFCAMNYSRIQNKNENGRTLRVPKKCPQK